MELDNIIKERRSIRNFKDEMVPKEMIDKILEAGLYAASGRGLQSPIIIAITNKEKRDALAKLNAKILNRDIDPFFNAPVVLLVIADKKVPTYLYDGSLVMGNMMLKAYELGLGSCWIHRAKEEIEDIYGQELLKELGIDGDYEGIGNLIIGYPLGDHPEMPKRKEKRIYYLD